MVIKTFNVDEKVYERFIQFCRDNGISMSKQIEMFMNYKLDVLENVERIFQRLSTKDKRSLEIINEKVKHILENPYQFKPLRGNMAGIRRVHIGKSFVLIYEIIESEKLIRILDYDHQDIIFKKIRS